MKISEKDVRHIATLARLELTDAEVETLSHQMGDILTYMDKLNEVDTTDVKPLSHVHDMVNRLREDKAEPSMSREDALKNAPETDGTFFKVPRVIKE
ncbi:MAG: Asp-tRNA(Asn)/Glu-tRNA(Gln) amidotransferase subunit GatC [Candidatus Marinimicrobia bacterium]|nr:Asp-tRNA(Asn)/Glu-tRNA(Gln) amidotransferase subunit GatC [Candidatus Neomarinimicrobiota bacterium]MCF7839900.1 Asp-tRNA(Asn)/Glu-tRNA(Gln) amidotransferase subunit GatC [Candidatus Neomarinimicrobiota bacterium]